MSEEGLSNTKVFSSSRDKPYCFAHILLDHVASSDTASHVFPFSSLVHSFHHLGPCQIFVTAINMTPASFSLPHLFWLPQTAFGCAVLTLQLCLGEFNLFLRGFVLLLCWLLCTSIFPVLIHIYPASSLCEISSPSSSAHPKWWSCHTSVTGPHTPYPHPLQVHNYPLLISPDVLPSPQQKQWLAPSLSIQITVTFPSNCQHCYIFLISPKYTQHPSPLAGILSPLWIPLPTSIELQQKQKLEYWSWKLKYFSLIVTELLLIPYINNSI